MNLMIWFRAQFLGYPYWSVDVSLDVLKGCPRHTIMMLDKKRKAKWLAKKADGIAYIDYNRVRNLML